MALVLHLGGVGECVRLIWEWSVHNQESGDLQVQQAFLVQLRSIAIRFLGIWWQLTPTFDDID